MFFPGTTIYTGHTTIIHDSTTTSDGQATIFPSDMTIFYTTVFPSHEEVTRIIEATMYTILMVAAILANLIAMATILKTWTPHNHHNILIFNLSLVDLGIMLFSMTFSVASFFDNGETLRGNRVLCQVYCLFHSHFVSFYHFIL